MDDDAKKRILRMINDVTSVSNDKASQHLREGSPLICVRVSDVSADEITTDNLTRECRLCHSPVYLKPHNHEATNIICGPCAPEYLQSLQENGHALTLATYPHQDRPEFERAIASQKTLSKANAAEFSKHLMQFLQESGFVTIEKDRIAMVMQLHQKDIDRETVTRLTQDFRDCVLQLGRLSGTITITLLATALMGELQGWLHSKTADVQAESVSRDDILKELDQIIDEQPPLPKEDHQ